jgi:hypothetical protein
VRQVAALKRGVPNLPSKDTAEGEMTRCLRGLLANRTVGLGVHTMPQHAIRRSNLPLHCELDVDPAFGWTQWRSQDFHIGYSDSKKKFSTTI